MAEEDEDKELKPSTYLERRVEYLLKMMKDGKLHLDPCANKELRNELALDLYNIQRFPSGRIDLKTCTPLVRSIARSQYALKDIHLEEQVEGESQPQGIAPVAEVAVPSNPFDAQREYFAILLEFFKRLTGKRKPSQFATPETFLEVMKRNSDRFVRNHNAAFTYLDDALSEFYYTNWLTIPESARSLGGMKFVLGAGQRYPATAGNAVRSMLLYADTVLIPDPVLPWLEMNRSEEKFPSVWLSNYIFQLLFLKPFVDADLAYPPVLVVPTFDRRLTVESDETKDAIARLDLAFFSTHLGTRFEDESEIFDFAASRETEFLRTVEEKKLFYPPQTGSIPKTAAEAAQLYRDYIVQYRNEPYVSIAQNWGDGPLIVQGIRERLEPQFHLGDNAEWLGAQPMLWNDAHWHYFRMCAGVSEERLQEESLLSTPTIATMRSLSSPDLAWLGNVPIKALVELRKNGENERFRRAMQEFTGALHEAALEDVDRVAAEVSRGIASLLQEHQKDVYKIDEEYNKKYLGHAVTSFLSLAAVFLPWLAPLYSPIPSGLGLAIPAELARRYLADKLGERSDRKKASQSLTGVLAAARGEVQNSSD